MPITVEPLALIGKDDRGATFHIENDRGGNFILAYRKAGSSSGRHYHTGKAAYKNPEILYLLSGQVYIRWRDPGKTEIVQTQVQAPAKVIFPVQVWHELVAITDCSFWEMNALADVQRDSVRVENPELNQ